MIWDYCKHINRYERFGDADKMNGLLVILLDIIREESKQPLVVHCGIEGSGHATKSYHYTGDAVDFHLVGCDLPCAAIKILETLKRMNIKYYGLGAYPYWNNKGFHLDLGYRKDNEKLYWVGKEDNTYDYYKDTGSFIKAISL